MARPVRSWLPFRASTLAALPLLLIPLGVGIAGAVEDSAVIDELTHIPAGVSYILKGDLRLNPEHPPLVKDLAGLSVLTWARASRRSIVFPDWLPDWRDAANGEWGFGGKFLYTYNHEPTALIFWARLPVVLLTVGFAAWFFAWVRRRWGAGAGLLALALTALSPTLLGHGHVVTTDAPATAAFLVATVALLSWLAHPNWRRGIVASVVVGLALLVKFSVLLLLPLALVFFAIHSILQAFGAARPQHTGRHLLGLLLILATAVIGVVWPVYLVQIRNYPAAKQQADLLAYNLGTLEDPAIRAVHRAAGAPGLRALAYYATGVLDVASRSEYGNTTYFRGEVFTGGRWSYFPIVTLAKEPLPALLLVLTGAVIGGAGLLRSLRRGAATRWFTAHWFELCLLTFLTLYWLASTSSSLNIGVRHVLPTFPFAWALAAAALAAALRRLAVSRPPLARAGVAAVVLLLAWQAWSVLRAGVGQLGYFNELAGGVEGGSRIVTDSNLDWGQDLRRLHQFVEQRGIDRIAVDYFGGGSLALEVGPAAVDHNAEDGPLTGWFAISETYRTIESGLQDRYAWLRAYQPVARVGTSILVYHIPP